MTASREIPDRSLRLTIAMTIGGVTVLVLGLAFAINGWCPTAVGVLLALAGLLSFSCRMGVIFADADVEGWGPDGPPKSLRAETTTYYSCDTGPR